ncbi:MAG: hypothetical protein Q7K57_36260 [Burkholderiaceae bacterium]|nr:hypothetical protein [Burkholderiaceae bacterium]
MNSDTALMPFTNRCLQARQLSLFPLDTLGAVYAFEVIDHPAPGISRAMIGPLPLGQPFKPERIKCLAATADGLFASAVSIELPQLQDADDFWGEVRRSLEVDRLMPIGHDDLKWHFTSEKCLQKWAAPQFWGSMHLCKGNYSGSVRALSQLLKSNELGNDLSVSDDALIAIEVRAADMLLEQMRDAVRWVMGGLVPALCEVILERPGLSIGMADQIIAKAKRHHPTSVAYALQALKNESLGVLHLIASGQPELDARIIQEALFGGHSVPDAFAGIGVAKSTYRRTVSRPTKSTEAMAKQAISLSDLPIAGREWLLAMRLTEHLPLQHARDVSEFSRLLSDVMKLKFQQDDTAPRLLQWSIRPGYLRCCIRMTRLISQAQASIGACDGLIGFKLTFDDAVHGVLDWLEHRPEDVWVSDDFGRALDPDNFGQVIACAAFISKHPISQLMLRIFEAHPGLPSKLRMQDPWTLHVLDTLDLAVSHGHECNNCLQSLSTVVSYVIEGTALYAVHTASGVAGTIALRYDSTEWTPKVEVLQITGVKNAVANYDLCRLAQCLAESWTTEEQETKWTAYENRCTHWRSLVSKSASQLSQ